jgi:hypothetical protein
MTNLSPAAQAVLDAFLDTPGDDPCGTTPIASSLNGCHPQDIFDR